MLATSEQMMAAELSIKKVKKIDNESKLNKFLKQALKQQNRARNSHQAVGEESGSCYFLNSKEAVMRGYNPQNSVSNQEYFARGNIQREFAFKEGIAEPQN